jgi:predicted PurR-regulated permease PerM
MKHVLPLNYRIPTYLKYFFITGNLVLTIYILFVTQSIVKPLLAAFIISLLLKPLSVRLELIRIPRVFSTLIAMLVILCFIAIIITFFSIQAALIASDVDAFVNSFNQMFDQVQKWAALHFGLEPKEIVNYLKSSIGTVIKTGGSYLQGTISATAGFFTALVLFLISLFFFIYYRGFLVSFLYLCVKTENHPTLTMTIGRIETVIKRYIWGLFLVILTMATLNIIGLLSLGISHAIFFGAFGALLTIIPYVGIIIGSLLPTFFALFTMNSIWYPIGVILIFSFVQFLEGNFITPNIVGNQVSINPFAALLGLFLGGMFFGIVGIIFAIPILAILKVICDSVESLKAIGYLIGNPPSRVPYQLKNKIYKYFNRLLQK